MSRNMKPNIQLIAKDEVWTMLRGVDSCLEDKYLVSNYSRVFSLRRNRICKGAIDKNGYHKVTLSHSINTKFIAAHRLAAFAFIPNPENKPFINHKDGNKANNHVDNLEWCTNAENIQHGYDNGLINKKGSRTGWKMSDQTKRKIAKTVSTQVVGGHKRIRKNETGEIFDCVADAIKDAKVCKATFHNKMKANEAIRGFTYTYLERILVGIKKTKPS